LIVQAMTSLALSMVGLDTGIKVIADVGGRVAALG
jgi:hypothetical protein